MEPQTAMNATDRPKKATGMLLTAGYEGADPAVFRRLVDEHSAIIIDVRAHPHSRDKRWGKTSLARRYKDRYRHARGLGNLNHRVAHAPVVMPHPGPWIDLLCAWLERGENVLLLCYEAYHMNCHRTEIADMVAQRMVVGVRHLTTEEMGGV